MSFIKNSTYNVVNNDYHVSNNSGCDRINTFREQGCLVPEKHYGHHETPSQNDGKCFVCNRIEILHN